jgi:hypothetical protein
LAGSGNYQEGPRLSVFLLALRQGHGVAVGRDESRRRQAFLFAPSIGNLRQNLNSLKPERGKSKLEKGNWPLKRSQYP